MRFSELYGDKQLAQPAMAWQDASRIQEMPEVHGNKASSTLQFRGIEGKTPPLPELLPLEIRASEAIVDAVKLFFVLADQSGLPSQKELTRQFVDGIHLCQTNLGAVRFFHALNQRERKAHGYTTPLMTSPEKLRELERWKIMFEAQWKARQYAAAPRKIMERLMAAWEDMMALTQDYPDQHNYDDFMRGMALCEYILSRMKG